MTPDELMDRFEGAAEIAMNALRAKIADPKASNDTYRNELAAAGEAFAARAAARTMLNACKAAGL